MSKIMDALRRAEDAHTPSDGQKDVPAARGPDSIMVWAVIITGLVGCIVAVIFLEKGLFGEDRHQAATLKKLIKETAQQNEKIKSLEDKLSQLASQQAKEYKDSQSGINLLENQIKKMGKEAPPSSRDYEALYEAVTDLKVDYRGMLDKYINLNADVKSLRTMMGTHQ